LQGFVFVARLASLGAEVGLAFREVGGGWGFVG